MGSRLWRVREAMGAEAREKDGPEGRLLQSRTTSLRTL